MTVSLMVHSTIHSKNIVLSGNPAKDQSSIQKPTVVHHGNDEGYGGGRNSSGVGNTMEPTHDCNSNGTEEEIILKPREHDVLLGRGGMTNSNPGNIHFRKLVNQHKMRYLSANKIEKPKVAREVVNVWKQMDPPGRFLQKKDEGDKGAAPVWIETSDKKAQEKASQCLRERTSDVLPYLSKLQEHRVQLREQGVSLISNHFQGDQLQQQMDQSNSSTSNNNNVNHDFSAAMPNMSVSGPGDLRRNSLVTSMSTAPLGNNHNMMMNPMMNRRISMPAGGPSMGTMGQSPHIHPHQQQQQYMSAARRTSMPTISHLQGGATDPMMTSIRQHNSSTPLDFQHNSMGIGGQQHQQVLRDAYAAVERSGGVDPQTNMMFMQQMRLQEQQAAMAMMQQNRGSLGGNNNSLSTMMPTPFANHSSAGIPLAHDAMTQEQQKMLLATAAQRERYIMHQNMKESLIDGHRAQLQQEQQANVQSHRSSPTSTSTAAQAVDGPGSESMDPDSAHSAPIEGLDNIEPIPFSGDDTNDYVIPLSDVMPEMAKSSPASKVQQMPRRSPVASLRNKTVPSSDREHQNNDQLDKTSSSSSVNAPANPVPQTPDWKRRAEEALERFSPITTPQCSNQAYPGGSFAAPAPTGAQEGLNNGPQSHPDEKRQGNAFQVHDKDNFAPPPPAAAPAKLKSAFKKTQTAPDDETVQLEYRKTLEDYMTNHQSTARASGAIDIDDDISENAEDVGGVDASAWIQQALHDSNNSGEMSLNNTKRKKKRQESRAITNESRNYSREDFMSTDGKSMDAKSMDRSMDKSMDCKSLDSMSIMSLAISEMEKSLEQVGLNGPDGESDLDSETINFGSQHTDAERRMMARGNASTQSIMSELTDFSIDGDDTDDDDNGDF